MPVAWYAFAQVLLWSHCMHSIVQLPATFSKAEMPTAQFGAKAKITRRKMSDMLLLHKPHHRWPHDTVQSFQRPELALLMYKKIQHLECNSCLNLTCNELIPSELALLCKTCTRSAILVKALGQSLSACCFWPAASSMAAKLAARATMASGRPASRATLVP